jgi:hypothetical protein
VEYVYVFPQFKWAHGPIHKEKDNSKMFKDTSRGTLPSDYNQSEDNLAARIFSSYENCLTTVTQMWKRCQQICVNHNSTNTLTQQSHTHTHTYIYIYSSLSYMVIVTVCNECPHAIPHGSSYWQCEREASLLFNVRTNKLTYTKLRHFSHILIRIRGIIFH